MLSFFFLGCAKSVRSHLKYVMKKWLSAIIARLRITEDETPRFWSQIGYVRCTDVCRAVLISGHALFLLSNIIFLVLHVYAGEGSGVGRLNHTYKHKSR